MTSWQRQMDHKNWVTANKNIIHTFLITELFENDSCLGLGYTLFSDNIAHVDKLKNKKTLVLKWTIYKREANIWGQTKPFLIAFGQEHQMTLNKITQKDD